MAKYILVGDSYGVLDETHSHWAKLWADKHGHTVDLLGLEGSNLVNISSFVDSLDLSSYDGLIYHFTSLLRTETTSIEGGSPNFCIIDQLGKISIDDNNDFFDHCLPKVEKGYNFVEGSLRADIHQPYVVTDVDVTPFNMVSYWYDGKATDTITDFKDGYDKFMTSRANGIYNNTSIRWIVRANMMAYTNTIMMLDRLGIKHVTVFPTCGGFKPVQSYLKSKFNNLHLWDQTDIAKLHPNETESRNHINLETAQKLADSFIFP